MPKIPIRPIRIEGNFAYVPLTKGYKAVIDVDDLPLVDAWNWRAMIARRADGNVRAVYVIRQESNDGKRRTILLHRVIAGTPDGFETDHIDGDGLNNRKKNLRNATSQQNRCNQRNRCDSASGVKGVSWSAFAGKWHARIAFGGVRRHIGYYSTPDAAAAAYAAASAELHGEFGRTA